jgi:hypothetical protein
MHPLRLAARGVATGCLVLLTGCGASSVSGGEAGAGEPTPDLPPMSGPTEPGHCSGRIEAVSVDGDVTVPNGATCELLGTHVDGNISIGHGGRLYASGVDVDGDIEGERTLDVEVTAGSNIGGNLQLESGEAVRVTGSHVDGDLSWQGQDGALELQGATVRGNVVLEENTGGVTVSSNRIGGDLSCEDNAPPPAGGGNAVSGERDEQCGGL